MEKRSIGQLKVTPIGVGCMGFSHGYGKIPEHDYSVAAIRAAHDFGCNFFDTAEGYGEQLFYTGHNEEILGEAVQDFRKDVVIATKFNPRALPEVMTGQKLYNFIRERLLASLLRLKTDFVDIYYLHRTHDDIPIEEFAEIYKKFIDEGLIREWGLSQVETDTIDRACKIAPVAAVQNLYNLVERDCEKNVFPYSLEHKIAVISFSPISSGLLSGKISTQTQFEKVDDVRNFVPQLTKENIEANQPLIDLLTDLANQKHATNAQISLAWMLKKYPNVIPIPGSKNRERILENLGAWNVELSDSEFDRIEKFLATFEVKGHRGIVESNSTTFIKSVEVK